MKKITNLTVAFLLTFAISMVATSATLAGTPDGVTPANEGVCDSVIGATKGLYGLCVAYCEAQDAEELVYTDDLESLKVPSRNILKNYERRMKEGDPQMPCVNYASACPVFDAADLAKINSTIGDLYENDNSYVQPFNQTKILRESVRNLVDEFQLLPLWLVGRSSPVVSALIAERTDGSLVGQYYDDTGSSVIFRGQELTQEEYNGCEIAIKANVVDKQPVGFCGDGIRTAGPETCDDGNNSDGDGCSAVCTIE